jgi:primosomal protein N' (replication factor Y)
LFDRVGADDRPPACRLFAKIVFNRPLRTAFTYGVPPLLEPLVAPGKRVLAPFGKGNNRTTGYCVGLSETTSADPATIKRLTAVTDEAPLLGATMLELTRWMADRYQCGWGQVLEAVVPAAVKSHSGQRWLILYHAVPQGEKDLADLTTKQRRAYELLVGAGRPMEMRELFSAAGCSSEVVKALFKKGWATISKERDRRSPPNRNNPHLRKPALALSPAQHAAVAALATAVARDEHSAFLLHGVTGSGKTEVYLQAIAAAVAAGKQAVVLVPEISLTPQTIQRFRERFDNVAVLHSRLTDVERHAFWRRIADGEVEVVVGARSALFAPCPRLGVLVVDEEHETTYKQESTPRYHVRTVARERCRLENAVLVLGSATPALESWRAALDGELRLLSLPDRISGRPMPPVTIVDMRGEYKKTKAFRALSQPLLDGVRDAVKTGGQVILLLNRRGFSTSVFCPMCGDCQKCKHCDVALTFHRDANRLLCHQCDEEYRVPEKCPACGGQAIKFAGVGTEKLEEEVRKAFPDLRVARMDGDTMRNLGAYEKVLGGFRDGAIDLLLGTQMIAKGLDFPNVSLVGVVSADTAMHLPDFRADERTFQLIAQVAGRTGRGDRAGRVLVQTFNPEDRAIACAAAHDFFGFAAGELPSRKAHGYPPFGRLARLVVRSPSATDAERFAASVGKRLRERADSAAGVRILGPAPAPIGKLQDKFRFHLQILARTDADLQRSLDVGLDALECPKDVEFAVDVDPMSFL